MHNLCCLWCDLPFCLRWYVPCIPRYQTLSFVWCDLLLCLRWYEKPNAHLDLRFVGCDLLLCLWWYVTKLQRYQMHNLWPEVCWVWFTSLSVMICNKPSEIPNAQPVTWGLFDVIYFFVCDDMLHTVRETKCTICDLRFVWCHLLLCLRWYVTYRQRYQMHNLWPLVCWVWFTSLSVMIWYILSEIPNA